APPLLPDAASLALVTADAGSAGVPDDGPEPAADTAAVALADRDAAPDTLLTGDELGASSVVDATSPSDAGPRETAAPHGGTDTVRPSSRHDVAPPAARAPEEPDSLVLTLAEGGLGPVYVSGAGTSGLAPRELEGMAPDAAQLLRLRGGKPSFEVRLRLTRRGEHAVATVGAPAGTFYQARCGAAAGPTPLVGLAV